MREPLYRAKTRGSNPEWVYGYYCKYGKHIDKIHCVNKDGYAYLQIGIDVVTLGQYTGLTDKNDNKIFEGDIIKVVTEDTHEERFIEVGIGEFTDDGSGDLFIGAYLKYDGFTVSAGQIKECGSNGVEVVGNIYDNPELLE